MKRTREGAFLDDHYRRNVRALNINFYNWFSDKVKHSGNGGDSADYQEAAADYVVAMKDLQSRYLRPAGDVLTFGSGDCCQLGHGNEEDDDLMVKYPRVVSYFPTNKIKLVAIACGGLHNVVITDTGVLYTWGCNDDASLGRPGKDQEEAFPAMVRGAQDELVGKRFVSVACGDGHSMAVTDTGDVYGWGCYKDKEGKTWFNPAKGGAEPEKDIKKKQLDPLLIDKIGTHAGLSPVVDITCGSSVNLARCADGSLYSWGSAECGELGRKCRPMKYGGDPDAEYDKAAVLADMITPGFMYKEGGEKMKDCIAFGAGAGGYHSLVVGTGGQVYTCGLNNYGQLGHGDLESRDELTPISSLAGLRFVAAKGGTHHSLLLTDDGKLVSFGRGDYGQQGVSFLCASAGATAGACTEAPILPVVDDRVVITKIQCGANHNLALSEANEVFSWGYGDMLALGTGKEKDEDAPFKIKSSGGKVVQIACGGQHSAVLQI
jgi:regulator of chromosome condensation